MSVDVHNLLINILNSFFRIEYVSTKRLEFIIKSHASSNKARTLAQIVEGTYEPV
jgi:hypothetical protein